MDNIVIDGNYLFYKTLFIFKREDGKKVLEPKSQQMEFMQKVATDFSFIIRQFSSPKRIVFLLDSKSWRKDVKIVENEGYKSDRKYNDDIDWTAFYDLMQEFADILSDKGIIFSKLDRSEGDDLAYLWSNEFFKMSENCIVITGDHDLLQTAKKGNDACVVVYNPNSRSRKITGELGLKDMLDNTSSTVDLFNISGTITSKFDKIKNIISTNDYEEVEVYKFLINKVILGDSGDSVPGIFRWTTQDKHGNPKINKLTIKRTQKILDDLESAGLKYDEDTLYNLGDWAELMVPSLKKMSKSDDIDVFDLKMKILRNTKLMVLDEKTIPLDILENFDEHFAELIKLPELGAREYNQDVLLEGTDYKRDSSSKSFDMFGKLNKRK